MFGWLIDLVMMIINFIMSFFSTKHVQFSEDTKKESVTDTSDAATAEESSDDKNVLVNE